MLLPVLLKFTFSLVLPFSVAFGCALALYSALRFAVFLALRFALLLASLFVLFSAVHSALFLAGICFDIVLCLPALR